MRSNLSVQKSEAVAGGSMVTAMHGSAAEAGIAVLRAGGNAVDAAVTMAFVLGVVEPCMSGLGGGGCMVLDLPHDGTQVVIDHNMQASLAATADMFDVVAGAPPRGFYGWPAVRGDENTTGYRAVAIPGTVAGLCLALERYGTIDLDQALRPAISLAEDGFGVDWFLASILASDARELRRFPETARVFLEDGLPLSAAHVEEADRLIQRDLARTLRLLARHGPQVFYHGEIAQRIAAAMSTHNGLLTADDLAQYAPLVSAQRQLPSYRGYPVLGVIEGSGSTTTLQMLTMLEQFPVHELGHNSAVSLRVLADVFRQAFADRFAYLADPRMVEVPTERLWSRDYAAQRAASIRDALAQQVVLSPPTQGDGGPPLGALRDDPAHTTHLCVVDRTRNAVALTQTLLSTFGAKIVVPETGIVLNNGMMWFDPRPGQANSVAGGKRCLSAMSPLILRRDDAPYLLVGASGGRRIMTAVTQVISNVIDFGMGIQEAVSAPRLHCEGRQLVLDHRIDERSAAALARGGYEVTRLEESYTTFHFALANAIGIDTGAGTLRGGVDPLKPGVALGSA
jgi:gamma-glutamyltranspeptidase/glutathione hydrolase